MTALLCETTAQLRRWWRRKYWVWPWEVVDGPVWWSYGLGFWSLWWSELDGWSIEWNVD